MFDGSLLLAVLLLVLPDRLFVLSFRQRGLQVHELAEPLDVVWPLVICFVERLVGRRVLRACGVLARLYPEGDTSKIGWRRGLHTAACILLALSFLGPCRQPCMPCWLPGTEVCIHLILVLLWFTLTPLLYVLLE